MSRHVLVVDDEADIQTVTKMGLTLLTDWQVSTAISGHEGLAIAQDQQPDAILLDVMMPDLDGLSTLKALQDNPKTHHIPVIFLTAKAQATDRRQFYAAGARGVITKPFDPTTLASQIAGFLNWEES